MSLLTDTTGRAFAGAVHSLVLGQVADNRDPADLGRVRVMFPTLAAAEGGGAPDDQRTSGWFRVARPLAAQSGELFSLPDVGDEVVVGFLDGDPEVGIVLGQISSIHDKPHEDIYVPARIEGKTLSEPSTKRGEEFENHRRVWRSRLGHMIVLDDTPEAPLLQLFNPDRTLAIVFDEKAEQLLITNTKTDIRIEGGRDIVLLADGNLVLDAKKNVTVKAGESFELTAGKKGTISTGAALDIDGQTITLN
ncbi:MAG: phage baseplate assembly protein V [Myxococcota bacterium]